MLTRTERLRAGTFMEKLSRRNCLRRKLSHKDNYLARYPEIQPKSGDTIATKKEHLAAANFLMHHGNIAALEALSDDELVTINAMLNNPPESSRDELLERAMELATDSSGSDIDLPAAETPEAIAAKDPVRDRRAASKSPRRKGKTARRSRHGEGMTEAATTTTTTAETTNPSPK